MDHGIDTYFAERARNGRRLSITAAALGLIAYALLSLGRTPPIQQMINDPVRFGFEGPDQYVRRITIQSPPGDAQNMQDLGAVREHSTRRGGSPTPAAARSDAAAPRENRLKMLGPGEAEEDLLARAFNRRSDVPVFQSQELIIEKLVKPAYPDHALEHEIEGHLAVMALVDTSGHVVEVQVLANDAVADREFGAAASDAVWRCEFRPYNIQGRRREVYALFRFNFTIY
jgi:TonB family protein